MMINVVVHQLTVAILSKFDIRENIFFCFWLLHILMPYNMIILYFCTPYFHVPNSALLHSTSVLTLYIDLTLSILSVTDIYIYKYIYK